MTEIVGDIFHGKNKKLGRVAVAMSGGVDSSVAAALLLEQGYEVIGITLKLFDENSRKEIRCVKQDVQDAKRVAEKLGIEHITIDCEDKFFSEVVEYFADSYLRGETPLPCAVCNAKIKFGELLDISKEMGAEFLATGHYARLFHGKNGTEIHKGASDERDQSYFLFSMEKARLDFLRFPLGEMDKRQTRAIAEKYNLPVSAKLDSQDICFVPNGDYAEIVNRLRPGANKAGDILDERGNALGRHDGILNFTVGQRRGLNLNSRGGENNEPLYVVGVEPETNCVIVAEREALAKTEVRLRDVNWLGEEVPAEGIMVKARLRSAQPLTPARFIMKAKNTAVLVFDDSVYGVAPGQAGVVYDGSRMLGGGWIQRTGDRGQR